MIVTQISRVVFSATSKDAFILLLGNGISVAINFLLIIILSNNLTIGEFGLFITGLTLIQLVSDSLGLGINPANLNLIPKADKKDQQKLIQTSFLIQLGIGIAITLIFLFFSQALALTFFHNVEMATIIQISGLGSGLLLLLFWAQTIFQAQKQFLKSAVVNTLINIFRLTIFGSLLILGTFSLIKSFLWAQLVLIPIIFLALYWLRTEFKSVEFNWKSAKQLLKFGLPVGIGFAIAAFFTKIDQLLIFNQLGEEAAGIYGLAYRLILPIILAATAFTSATTPRFASIDKTNFESYFKKVLFITFGLGCMSLLGIFIAPILIPIFFGLKFEMAILPFQILIIGIFFYILSSPFMTAIVYRFSKNYFYLFISSLSLITLIIGLSYLIQPFGIIGGAISVSLAYFIQFMVVLIYFLKLRGKLV